MCVLGVEGSKKKMRPTPSRVISGTALRRSGNAGRGGACVLDSQESDSHCSVQRLKVDLTVLSNFAALAVGLAGAWAPAPPSKASASQKAQGQVTEATEACAVG